MDDDKGRLQSEEWTTEVEETGKAADALKELAIGKYARLLHILLGVLMSGFWAHEELKKFHYSGFIMPFICFCLGVSLGAYGSRLGNSLRKMIIPKGTHASFEATENSNLVTNVALGGVPLIMDTMKFLFKNALILIGPQVICAAIGAYLPFALFQAFMR